MKNLLLAILTLAMIGVTLAGLLSTTACEPATIRPLPCNQVCTVEFVVQDYFSGQYFCTNGMPCILRGLDPPCADPPMRWVARTFPLKITWGDLTLFDGNMNSLSKDGRSSVQLTRCLSAADIDNGALGGLKISYSTDFYVQGSPLCNNTEPPTVEVACKCVHYRAAYRNEDRSVFWDKENCKINVIMKAIPITKDNGYECVPCTQARGG